MNDELDFEGTGTSQQQEGAKDVKNEDVANQEDKDALGGQDHEDVTGKDGDDDKDDNKGGDDTDDNSSTGELEVGTEVEYDGNVYTVAENGDLVDKDGKVFKEAKDVKAWLDESSVEDDDKLSVDAIRAAIGVDVIDNDGNPVQFTNDAEGIKNYVDSVISLKSEELQEAAINKLYADNPILKQFTDYITVHGTYQGFGELQDRSTWTLDKDNDNQLETVIRIAAQEFGNKSITDTYIKYLKESGALYDEAKQQLAALVEKDKRVREEYDKQAKEVREQRKAETLAYFQKVYDTIEKGVIGEYKLPDTIVKEVNGKKVTLTKKDFYNYVSQPIQLEDGRVATQYNIDSDNLGQDENINRNILDAWLMFTGGSYKDLVDMAVKEDKVRKLIVKSKEQRSARTIKIQKPKTGKLNPDDIILS